MKLRGFRSLSLMCVVSFILSTICILLLTLAILFAYKIIKYNHFVQTFQFSTVPFWQDDRMVNRTKLVPMMSIENVNLSSSTIVIASTCRNVGKYLAGFQRNVRAITKLFNNYWIYLCESDSDDETLQILYEWEKTDPTHVRLYSKGKLQWHIPARTGRIASCRNTLIKKIREDLSSFDYYFVIDIDVGSSSLFDVKDFLSNFIYSQSSWLALTATQRSEYYDIWALRIKSILPFDCWEKINGLPSFLFGQQFLIKKLIRIHQKAIPRHISLIEVDSAFGGATIYNGKYLNNTCLYSGYNEDQWIWKNQQCEHVSFNLCLQKYAANAKIYINPMFQIN